MERFILQPGVATTILDFTNEFSPLLMSLIGLVWLSATMIAVIALRHYWLEKTRLGPREESSGDRRKAA
jgi:ABC-type uncharacterized transport system permease subunit